MAMTMELAMTMEFSGSNVKLAFISKDGSSVEKLGTHHLDMVYVFMMRWRVGKMLDLCHCQLYMTEDSLRVIERDRRRPKYVIAKAECEEQFAKFAKSMKEKMIEQFLEDFDKEEERSTLGF
jgi:hypothetical protein